MTMTYDYTDNRPAPADAGKIENPENTGDFSACLKFLGKRISFAAVAHPLQSAIAAAIDKHPRFPSRLDGEHQAMTMASEAAEMYHAMTHYGRSPTPARLKDLAGEALDTCVVCLRSTAGGNDSRENKAASDIPGLQLRASQFCDQSADLGNSTLAELCSRALNHAAAAHKYCDDLEEVERNAYRLLHCSLAVAAVALGGIKE